MRSAKYLCFISYASSNEDFVDDLGEALGTELERWVRGKGLFIYKKNCMAEILLMRLSKVLYARAYV